MADSPTHPLLVRKAIGTQLDGYIAGRLPSGAWRIQTELAEADVFVLLRDRKDGARVVGDKGRFWVLDVDPPQATLLVTDDSFGFLPISDGMRARYRLALTSAVTVLETGTFTPDHAAQLSELKGMFNRCLRKDQRDWAAVLALFGHPEELELRRAVGVVTELRQAFLAPAKEDVARAVDAANRRDLLPRLTSALAKLDTDRKQLPQARRVAPKERIRTNARPARTMVEVDLEKVRRASGEHERTLQVLRAYLEAAGYIVEANVHVDAFARLRTGPALFEVKSIHNENETSQLREALSQLYEYRYRYERDATLWVVLSQPLSPATAWMREYLQEDRGVGVLWCDETGTLAGDWLPRLTETLHSRKLREKLG